MAGIDVADRASDAVEHGDPRGDELIVRPPRVDESVEVRHGAGGVGVLLKGGVEETLGGGHQHGRGDAVAGDVA